MQEDEPRVIDAKFKVVRDPYRLRWWQGWYIDREVFWVCAIGSVLSALPYLIDALQ